VLALFTKIESASSASKKRRILVIDDDKSLLESLSRVIEKNGYEADTAQTGKEAIGKSKEHTYDAVLIDLKLPDMDGIEILSKANLPNAVKIMLTGYPSLVSGIRAEDEGVDAYLAKPVRPEELLLLIKSKLKTKENNAANR